MYPNTTTSCRCVQATHWCTNRSKDVGCSAVCNSAGGDPAPQNYCVKGAAPPAPPDPAMQSCGQLIVRASCSTVAAAAALPKLSNAGRPEKVRNTRTQDFAAVPKSAPLAMATVNVTVPVGSRGEVHIPARSSAVGGDSDGTIVESANHTIVWRNGTYVDGADGVAFGGFDGRFVWFLTQPGNYSFTYHNRVDY